MPHTNVCLVNYGCTFWSLSFAGYFIIRCDPSIGSKQVNAALILGLFKPLSFIGYSRLLSIKQADNIVNRPDFIQISPDDFARLHIWIPGCYIFKVGKVAPNILKLRLDLNFELKEHHVCSFFDRLLNITFSNKSCKFVCMNRKATGK